MNRGEALDGFKLDENTTIVIDPNKRNWAKSQKEMEDLQGRYIQFQISNRGSARKHRMRRLVRPNGAQKNAPPYMRADFAATLLPVRVAKLRAGS